MESANLDLIALVAGGTAHFVGIMWMLRAINRGLGTLTASLDKVADSIDENLKVIRDRQVADGTKLTEVAKDVDRLRNGHK